MANPFRYGELVSGEYFFDREKEKKELHQIIESAINVFLYGPRRYGKTSLVLEVLKERKGSQEIPIYLDLLKAPTKRKFLELYAREIAKAVTTKFDEALNFCKRTFSRLIPRIVFKANNIPEIEFDASWTRETETAVTEEVLALPEEIAQKKGRRVVVILDEFPEITNYDGKKFEGILRSFIQSHQDVSYIFTGSKRRLLLKMISDPKRAFYKSGKIMPLGKIPQEEFETFIAQRFKSSNIRIAKENIKLILEMTRNHPYYTQMLCWELWEKASIKKQALKEDISETLNTTLNHQREYFLTLWDNFSPHQKVLLLALAKEPLANIFSREFINKFGLATVSSVQKSLHRLMELEVVDKTNNIYEISDVFFNLWLREEVA